MTHTKFWQRLDGQNLLRLIIAVSAICISYEGMSQGIMGAVTVAPEFGTRMGFRDASGAVSKPTLQGGIAAIYYAGSLIGGFFAGDFSDRFGRIKGIWVACAFCFVGVVLQTAAVNLASMLVARVIAGIGVSFILVIAPSWTAELSPASHRGDTIALTFLANFSGIALAAWIGFGTSFTDAFDGQFRWRFCFATQLIPVAMIVFGSCLIPESPRWLVKEGRTEEAREIISILRGNGDVDHPDARREMDEIITVVQLESENASTNYIKMFLGIGSGDVHLGRRIQLAFWLQVLMQYGTGIASVVIYSGTIFSTAGYGATKSSLLSACLMIVGIIGTLIAAFTLDRVGRRRTLYWGAVTLSITLFIIGGLFRGALNNPDKAKAYGSAATAFVFLYLLIFSSSWLLIPFIYPTEIFPTWLRAKGNAFGVAGWAIGYGGGSLLVPVMFAGINEKTFYVFGAAMLCYIPLVYCFLPETSGRSLESIDLLFASSSAFVWKEEEEYRKRMAELEQKIALHLHDGKRGFAGLDEEKQRGTSEFIEHSTSSSLTAFALAALANQNSALRSSSPIRSSELNRSSLFAVPHGDGEHSRTQYHAGSGSSLSNHFAHLERPLGSSHAEPFAQPTQLDPRLTTLRSNNGIPTPSSPQPTSYQPMPSLTSHSTAHSSSSRPSSSFAFQPGSNSDHSWLDSMLDTTYLSSSPFVSNMNTSSAFTLDFDFISDQAQLLSSESPDHPRAPPMTSLYSQGDQSRPQSERHDPQLESAASWASISHFVSLYLQYLYPLLPLVHKPTFTENLATRRDVRDSDFRSLLLSIVAYVISQLPTSRLVTDQFDIDGLKRLQRRCHRMGKVLQRTYYGPTNLTQISTIIFDFFYLLSIGLGHTAGARLGQAVQLAYSMGMHSDTMTSALGLDAVEVQLRRRVFWQLYASDKTRAIPGHPMLVNDYEFTPSLPEPVDDEFITVLGFFPQPPNKTSVLAGFVHLSKVFQILSECFFRHRCVASGIGVYTTREWTDAAEERLHSILQDLSDSELGASGNEGDGAAWGREERGGSGRPAFAMQRANILITIAITKFALYDLRAVLNVDEEQLARERERIAREMHSLLRNIPVEDLASNGESVRGKVIHIACALCSQNPGNGADQELIKDWCNMLSAISFVQMPQPPPGAAALESRASSPPPTRMSAPS
ncbi:hypothetical protein P7C73_g2514, partial [Tremellales sp. Uapishka_1]